MPAPCGAVSHLRRACLRPPGVTRILSAAVRLELASAKSPCHEGVARNLQRDDAGLRFHHYIGKRALNELGLFFIVREDLQKAGRIACRVRVDAPLPRCQLHIVSRFRYREPRSVLQLPHYSSEHILRGRSYRPLQVDESASWVRWAALSRRNVEQRPWPRPRALPSVPPFNRPYGLRGIARAELG